MTDKIQGLGLNRQTPLGAVSHGTEVIGAEGSNFKNIMTEISKTVDLDPIFEKASQTYNVPVKLLKAMAKAESNFNPNAVSSCGAQGIMQLMPATAQALGVTDAFDPEQNIMGGAKYISGKLAQYDGDVSLALAAYQAGSGNVAKYGGVPPFKSTQTYIKNIFNYMNSDISAGSVTYGANGTAAKTATGAGSTDANALTDSASALSELSKQYLGFDISALNGENMSAQELLDIYRMNSMNNIMSQMLGGTSGGLSSGLTGGLSSGLTGNMYSGLLGSLTSSGDDGLMNLMNTYSRYNMLNTLAAINDAEKNKDK